MDVHSKSMEKMLGFDGFDPAPAASKSPSGCTSTSSVPPKGTKRVRLGNGRAEGTLLDFAMPCGPLGKEHISYGTRPGKHTKSYGKSTCLMANSAISMAMFNSYPPRIPWNLPCDLQNLNRNPNCCSQPAKHHHLWRGPVFPNNLYTTHGFFPVSSLGDSTAKLISLDPTLDFKSDSAGVRKNWRIVGLKKHGEINWWFFPTPLKNDGVKVSWDHDIPNLWNNKIPWFQTTNQNHMK